MRGAANFVSIIRLCARPLTGALSVAASLWGMAMTTGLWWLFAAIFAAGVLNVFVSVVDELAVRRTRQREEDNQKKLDEMREMLGTLMGPADIPPHLQDLRKLSNAQLKNAIAKEAQKMRSYAVESGEGGSRPAWFEVPGWDAMSGAEKEAHRIHDRLLSASDHAARVAAFSERCRPGALALWNELKRRGAKGDAIRGGESHAITDGGLAGPRPIEDAATALETLARELED